MQGFSRAWQRLVPIFPCLAAAGATFSRDGPGCLMWLQVVIDSLERQRPF